MQHVGPDAEENRIDLTLENLASGQRIELDANRMTQVLLNLLVNAIRYTPEGGSVRVVLEDRRIGNKDFLKSLSPTLE
ncbi:hypothetical protein D3P09_12715 [Paenibacillus pinisoli]|uniref:Histidine kinase domain-containing protein n=2 Tax=Paenibacillus pinisoli TaxID=1276110 RepID=A0A3A6Q2L1_9BACL|nr:hypothetical protein D3P09_12715 [Paenibacillus pinisoli]